MSRYDTPPYYITAYGLAVKHGFKGTEEEWLESLKASEIEIRYLDGMLQWRRVPNVNDESELSNVLMGDDESEDEAEDLYAWHDLIDIADIRSEAINQAMEVTIAAAELAKSEAEKAAGAKKIAEAANKTADQAKQSADIALGTAEKTQEKQQDLEQSVADIEATADEARSTAERANKAVAAALGSVQRLEDEQQDIHDAIDGKLPQAYNAKVGQYLQITKVDADGRVVEVMPVDAPKGGGYDGGDLEMSGGIMAAQWLEFTGPDGDVDKGAYMQVDNTEQGEDGSAVPVINHYSNATNSPVILRGIAPGVLPSDAANMEQLIQRLPQPTGKVSVGQYLQVSSVGPDGSLVLGMVAAKPPTDGVSPLISVENIEGGHRVTIADANGTKTVDVMDGEDGYTPVKGVDYFTDADKEEFLAGVEAVRYVEQTLTPEQQAQARENIGAVNVSAFTNDAEYVTNKAGLVNERLPSSIYGWIEGYYCNYVNGLIAPVAHYAVTDYLEVSSNWQKIKAYVRADGDLAGICFYNSAKGFVSGVQISDTDGAMFLVECDIPVGAAYFCVTTRLESINSAYVEVVKQVDGVLTRISALEALSDKTSAITYGYAVSNVLCIGDSLTNGAYYAGEANGLDIADGTAIAQNYPYYLSRMLHCRTTNAGTNGYSASDWYNRYINSYTYADFDTFIIWLGTNYGCTAMPTDAEISAFVPDSSASAATANQALYLIKIIQTIQAANPSCHIVLGTVFGSKSDKATNNDVVAQIAEKYGCQLVDMSDLSYSNHPELHAGVNNPHFGKAGNIYIANRLVMAINDYLASDPLSGDFGTTTEPMPTLTASEKEEIVAAVVASLPVYSGEVV